VRRAFLRAPSAGLLLVLASWRTAQGQSASELPVKPELRLDVTRVGDRSSVHVGGGVQIPMGYYTRIGVIGEAGTYVVSSSGDVSGRLDVVGRFLLDPFRQQRWGFSAGGGVSLRATRREGVQPYLVSLIDLEGPRSARGFAPAFQVGLGGGIRVGAALRWGAQQTR
jgi:hypothetical protein